MLNISNYNYKKWNERFPDYKVNLRELPIHPSWDDFIKKEYEKPYFKELEEFLSYCLEKTSGKINIFPYPDLVFNALNLTQLEDIKVVILGQDPYYNSEVHNGQEYPQAMGLSFSVPVGIDVPSSLKNIYKNMDAHGHLIKKPTHGNLVSWAYQGCLMLNTSLTVQKGYPNSHEKYWKPFTDTLIKYISDKLNNVVFVLWGNPSLSKINLIDKNKHKVLVSSHPSGLSYDRPLKSYKSFKDSDHFTEINNYLKSIKKDKIIWQV